MKTEVNPQDTTRAEAFQMWMTSPMPMVTLTKTFNVGKLVKASKKRNISIGVANRRIRLQVCWGCVTLIQPRLKRTSA
ncbi:MAG: hypothetical protein J6U51_09385 [Bacteroidales bacterium]|nr:hypothetical protein [Bacteroidales bacterium]